MQKIFLVFFIILPMHLIAMDDLEQVSLDPQAIYESFQEWINSFPNKNNAIENNNNANAIQNINYESSQNNLNENNNSQKFLPNHNVVYVPATCQVAVITTFFVPYSATPYIQLNLANQQQIQSSQNNNLYKIESGQPTNQETKPMQNQPCFAKFNSHEKISKPIKFINNSNTPRLHVPSTHSYSSIKNFINDKTMKNKLITIPKKYLNLKNNHNKTNILSYPIQQKSDNSLKVIPKTGKRENIEKNENKKKDTKKRKKPTSKYSII